MIHEQLIAELFSIRNKYGSGLAVRKIELLSGIAKEPLSHAKDIIKYHDLLQFLIAFPDNKAVYQLASGLLKDLEAFIRSKNNIQQRLFNTGINGSEVCGSWSFEIVKWLRGKYGKQVIIDSIIADEGQIMSILTAVMPMVEGEIMQDANATWKEWLNRRMKKGEDELDRFLAVFDQADMRCEVRDELWSALSINILVVLSSPVALPASITTVHYHRNFNVHQPLSEIFTEVAKKVKLSTTEAEAIIESARMVLVKHTREIDPITFSRADLVSLYELPRGISVALFGMVPDRRRPIDCYMGYCAFKNGLPVAYAGSWILFDSARIGLNIFPSYRGGESLHVFQQILNVHKQVYRLNRFSVDPYQIGRHNSDGIKSGAFWMYYKLGFRPIREAQKKLAESEAAKVSMQKGYRSPASVLRKFSESRLELILNERSKPFRFDAVDISLVYAKILEQRYNNDRQLAVQKTYNRLAKIIKPGKLLADVKFRQVLMNWSVLLEEKLSVMKSNISLAKALQKILALKVTGTEEAYVRELQKTTDLKVLMQSVVEGNGSHS